MNEQTDQQLLRDYAGSHSEPAFTELVRRHIDLVYSAALRMVCDAHQAEDVTQGVFVALAQNARQLTHHPVLSGWLHRTTQNLAANAVRTNVRRQTREQEAVAMNELLSAGSDVSWEHIAPYLDAALGELSEPERDAVLLRYFEKKSAQEMAERLGISNEAAQKRVSRAIERLREIFAKRGVTVGAGGLVVVISTNAVQAAPVGLAVTISAAAAFVGSTLTTTATATTTKAIAMTTIQKTIIGAALAAAVGTGIYETHHAWQQRTELQALQQQQASLAEQIAQLTRERDDSRRELAASRDDRARSNSNSVELAKLRGDNVRLRESAREAQLKAASAATTPDPVLERTVKLWAGRATLLRQRLEQTPGLQIPEISLLGEKAWLDAVKNLEHLETDADFRQAAANLRSIAKEDFGELARKALKKYAEANGGLLPEDFSQLKPFFDKPLDDAAFQRYTLQKHGKLGEQENQFLIAETAAPVDADYDLIFQYRMNGTRTSGVAGMLIEQAAAKFAQANNDRLPTEPSQLTPYLQQPVDPAKIQNMLDKIPPNIITLEQLTAIGGRKR